MVGQPNGKWMQVYQQRQHQVNKATAMPKCACVRDQLSKIAYIYENTYLNFVLFSGCHQFYSSFFRSTVFIYCYAVDVFHFFFMKLPTTDIKT